MAVKKAAKKAVKADVQPAAKQEEEIPKPSAKKTATKKPPAKKSVAATKTVAEESSETGVTLKKLPGKKKPPTLTAIAELAHSYWEQRGRHHGSHVDDWLRAEKELNS